MNINGLTIKELRKFDELVIKSNDEQLKSILQQRIQEHIRNRHI